MPLQDVRPFVRLSVSPSIRPSHVGIMSTLLTISSFVYPQVAPHSSLSVPNSMAIGLGPHYGCVVLFTGWFHRCIKLALECSSLMHRWNQPVNKTTHPNWSVDCKGVWKKLRFRPISRFISEMMQVRILWKANIKPYPSFWMMPFPMTLSDRYPRFQGHDIIQRQLNRKRYNIQLYLQWQQSRGERGASGARALQLWMKGNAPNFGQKL